MYQALSKLSHASLMDFCELWVASTAHRASILWPCPLPGHHLVSHCALASGLLAILEQTQLAPNPGTLHLFLSLPELPSDLCAKWPPSDLSSNVISERSAQIIWFKAVCSAPLVMVFLHCQTQYYIFIFSLFIVFSSTWQNVSSEARMSFLTPFTAKFPKLKMVPGT